ncbi:MAG: alpha/beta hydrolase [Parvibaculum sp.]
MANATEPSWLLRDAGEKIAYFRDGHVTKGKTGAIWLGGFKSDMIGTKASELARWAKTRERALLRFDYFGHGQSSGDFKQGTISQWLADALAVMDQLTEGPQILIGSSMGAWISLLVALARPDRVKGLLLIAPAPDFTEALMWERYDESVRKTLVCDGIYLEPSDYGDPYEITLKLIEDGRQHLLLDAPIDLPIPVRILQGMKDTDVPWQHAMRLAEQLSGKDVQVRLTKAGDHRLSEPDDILRLTETLDGLLATIEA